jgi:hypothetical protein
VLICIGQTTTEVISQGLPWQWTNFSVDLQWYEIFSGCWYEEISEASKLPKELPDTGDLFNCLVGAGYLFCSLILLLELPFLSLLLCLLYILLRLLQCCSSFKIQFHLLNQAFYGKISKIVSLKRGIFVFVNGSQHLCLSHFLLCLENLLSFPVFYGLFLLP